MDNNSSNSYGTLRVNVIEKTTMRPVEDAVISISSTGNPDNLIYESSTNTSGLSEDISLSTPPVEYSLFPADNQPYSEYNVKITKNGYDTALISGIQMFEGISGFQTIYMEKINDYFDPIVIGSHTLWGTYPPKIAEASIKPLNETGEIVLNRVVVPELIVVHDGPPADSSAQDYYVPYLDYIKNVACCEIYSTWPLATIQANVLAIMSFTLNRVYTEWYRNKGYNFTITSSTAYDHKWMNGKTIYGPISEVVDDLYNNYLSFPNVKQPILTQYCDGKRVSCPNWLSQWGSKTLGDDGLSASEILRYYYGDDMYINQAELISGIPSSYPGYTLTIGSSGNNVSTIQEQLNYIARTYTAIPRITVDGIYGTNTANAVKAFQNIFDLYQTGNVDYATWYKISQLYVALAKLAEL